MIRQLSLTAFTVVVGLVASQFAIANEETTTTTETKKETKEVKKASPKASGEKLVKKQGMEYQVVKAGKGAVAQSGKTVFVHYEGKLENGTVFDSSRKRAEPFSFGLGAGQVIKGWDVGVEGMKVGEKRVLHIPAEMGYGDRGVPGVIPPKSKLIFDVELLDVK